MFRYLKLLIFLVIFCPKGNSQELSKDDRSFMDRNDMYASETEKHIDSIITIHLSNNNFLNGIAISHEYSRRLYKIKRYSTAIKYGTLEISLYKKLDLKNDKYAKALYNLGLFYSKIGDIDSASLFYKDVVNSNKDEYSTGKAFCELGNYYYEKGDFFKAQDYYTKGISILEKFDRKKLLLKKYIDFSQVLGEMNTTNSLSKKLIILDNANELMNKVSSPFSVRDYISLNNEYANYFNSEETYNFKKARYYYDKNLRKSIEVKDSSVISRTYSNLGNLYIDSENIIKRDSALYFLGQGLKYSTNKEEKSLIYHNFSNYYVTKNQYLDALNNIQKSLVKSVNIGNEIETLPDEKVLAIAYNKYNVLSALIQKATILIQLYYQEKDLKYVELALSNLVSADTLINLLLRDSKEEGSRLYWRKEAAEIYLKGILVCEILNKKEAAFYFAEKKKALLLIEDISKNTNKSKLPGVVLERENTLKKKIVDIEKAIKEEKDNGLIKSLKNNRFKLKRQQESFEDSLEILFPSYHKEKQTTSITTISQVQENLDKKTVIISYVSSYNKIDDEFNKLYAVVISKSQTEIIEIGKLKLVEELIVNYRERLSKPFETLTDKLMFQEVANELYTLLIPKNRISIDVHQKHLMIIPDGKLQYIPFESLVIDRDTNRYLIEENEISYAYSISFLMHNNNVDRKATKDLVSFAPVNFNHNNLEEIIHSIDEIEAIGNHLLQNNYKEKDASKHNFLSNTDDYKIIHLATHANFSDKLQIAFHDSNLEYSELYTSRNQAELVVLSACNTSLGEIAEGEGVMSLARGFFYAGANTVISSLWNANDKSTAQIMESFYNNLEKGQTKSKALHNAKIKYLKSTSLSDASPHYWAGFVLIGDADTKLFSFNIFFCSILFSLFLVLIISALLFFIKKR